MGRFCFPAFIYTVLLCVVACNRPKPKPVSVNIHQQAVAVNGSKDSVVNNSRQNYGSRATVSEPCVKCLLGIIQGTKGYRNLASAVPSKNIVYNVNWITSSNPVEIDSMIKINNGMLVKLQQKDGKSTKMLATYVYNNLNEQFYQLNSQNQYQRMAPVDTASLKNIRRSCFWGVASAK